MVELMLYVLFVVPGLVYSIWRISARRQGCRSCGSSDLIPADSPAGRRMIDG